MADVFISYSSADRSKAEKLAAFLESKGYAVWFDKAIEAADHYRSLIMDQIDDARVVICIWTPNSIRSDWCRSEANRARVLGKLIPVRSSDLKHDDIPLPFGELHTISLDDENQIERAVVKQLLAPRIESPWLWRLWGSLKHEALSWISIIGAILTLTTGLKQLVIFAPVVKFLTDHFLGASNSFWSAALFFLPKVTLYDCVLLNLWLFFLVLFLAACSRSYVNPPLLSEKYLRDHLLGATAAFFIIVIFAATAQQLQETAQAESYVFGTLVSSVAHVFGGPSPAADMASRFVIMLALIVLPVGTMLALGFRFDPARYAANLWRIVAGLVFIGLLNLAHDVLIRTA